MRCIGGFKVEAKRPPRACSVMFRSLVHDVASDAHGVECRPPGLLVGFERLDGELPGLIDQAEWFTRAAPGAILAGEELPPRLPAPARRRRGLGRVMAALRRRRG